MARTLRDARLESPTARAKLKASPKPYYRALDVGVHLGYRKGTKGAGRWVLRRYLGNEAYAVETIGVADDRSNADGKTILNFSQAQVYARNVLALRTSEAAAIAAGPTLLVVDAVNVYCDAQMRAKGHTNRMALA